MKLGDYIKEYRPSIKVPDGLSARIARMVSKKARAWERKQMIKSGLISFIALLIGFYGLTGFILSVVQTDLTLYLSSYIAEPSLLFSSIGFRAFVERLPLLSMLLLVGASIFIVYYFVRLVRLNSHSTHEKAL